MKLPLKVELFPNGTCAVFDAEGNRVTVSLDWVQDAEQIVNAVNGRGVPEARVGTWISVKDRLPTDLEQVLVQGGIAYIRKGEWHTITALEWPGKPIQWEVTHWMPMPKGPDCLPQRDTPK